MQKCREWSASQEWPLTETWQRNNAEEGRRWIEVTIRETRLQLKFYFLQKLSE